MNNITVDELVSLIDENKKSTKKQHRPAIIWFDKVEGDILKYSPIGNYMGLAKSLAKNKNEVALNLQAGSPFTDHTKGYDRSKNIIRDITDKERYSFILPDDIKFDPNGRLLTKCYIHSSDFPDIGKNGLTTLEFSKMVHEKLKLPVFLFFSLKFREKIEGDFSDYDEYICTDNLEDIKKRWIERVSEKDADGFQTIDNFYLNFLKTAPNEILSSDFAKEEVMGVIPRYEKWEGLSKRMRVNIQRELSKLVGSAYDPNHFFTNGNLDFDKIEQILELIPEDKWEDWVNRHILKLLPNPISERDRIKLFKIFISVEKGYFPQECSLALLEYHGINN